MLLFEVGIKHHRQIANENAPEPRSANLVAVEQNQSVVARRLKLPQLFGEIFVEVDAKFAQTSSLMISVWQSSRLITARRNRSSSER